MDESIKQEIEFIKTNLEFIIKQNIVIQNSLEKISKALPEAVNDKNYGKAVDEFLKDFINNYP